jgi:hypothetical protein
MGKEKKCPNLKWRERIIIILKTVVSGCMFAI